MGLASDVSILFDKDVIALNCQEKFQESLFTHQAIRTCTRLSPFELPVEKSWNVWTYVLVFLREVSLATEQEGL